MAQGWTPEEDGKLIEMWARMTARMVAGLIGRSRNAVIGRARRLGLQPSGAIDPERRYVKPKPEPKPEPAQPIPQGLGIAFLDARQYQCRAIMEYEPEPPHLARFCGQPTSSMTGLSYCPEHLKVYTTRAYRRWN